LPSHGLCQCPGMGSAYSHSPAHRHRVLDEQALGSLPGEIAAMSTVRQPESSIPTTVPQRGKAAVDYMTLSRAQVRRGRGVRLATNVAVLFVYALAVVRFLWM